MKAIFVMLVATIALLQPLSAQFESDVIMTSEGELEMFFIGHGTLMFQFNDLVIHIDPVMREADYSTLPDADLILITHQHGDHLDLTAINHLLKTDTRVVMTETCMEQLEDFDAVVMKNGDVETIKGIRINAIPAYNLVNKRSNGSPYHPKGEGNGYIMNFGMTNVLIGGDTENIPEIKELKVHIGVAFLPMNLPYTMTPEMVADAARAFQPEILYPYHFGETDPQELVDLLKDEKAIEVRIRDLK
ncbi:MAG: MBL fold metallo-hydrolase [Bacteroidales bacterium]|nr:MBL fold metallo-hydrolase [Bacteroidales bacterium]